MNDPVVAEDHHSYEHASIQKWFDLGHTTSPLTRVEISTRLTRNQSLKTQIQDWVEDQLRGKADMDTLRALQAGIFAVNTADEAMALVTQLIELVTASKFCLLPISEVANVKGYLEFKQIGNDELRALLDVLVGQCQGEIKLKRTKHDELRTKCLQLEIINSAMKKTQQVLQKTVALMAKKMVVAENKVLAARLILQTYNEAKDEHEEAQRKLDAYNGSVTTMKTTLRELFNEKETIANELARVHASTKEEETNQGPSSPASSSSASSSSSSLSWVHSIQWLFDEGMDYFCGLNFKKKDQKRGRSMVEASASSGFPMSVAFCHYMGWNGMEQDAEKTFALFVAIEQDSQGYERAQHMVGVCYRRGYGTERDDAKAFEWYTKSSAQEHSLAMVSLGICYEWGWGCNQHTGKAIELYAKSARLGCSAAMNNLGSCYEHGRGVRKDVGKARGWYKKARAQGHEMAQDSLDKLDACAYI